MQTQRELQLRIEEQWKQLRMMIEQQQETAKSFMGSVNADQKSPNNLSATLEEPEIFVLDCSDDEMIFPSKIS